MHKVEEFSGKEVTVTRQLAYTTVHMNILFVQVVVSENSAQLYALCFMQSQHLFVEA